jgi:hypothetical protein
MARPIPIPPRKIKSSKRTNKNKYPPKPPISLGQSRVNDDATQSLINFYAFSKFIGL